MCFCVTLFPTEFLHCRNKHWRMKQWSSERCSGSHEWELQKKKKKPTCEHRAVRLLATTARNSKPSESNLVTARSRPAPLAATLWVSLKCRLGWYLPPVAYVTVTEGDGRVGRRLTDTPGRRSVPLLCLNIIFTMPSLNMLGSNGSCLMSWDFKCRWFVPCQAKTKVNIRRKWTASEEKQPAADKWMMKTSHLIVNELGRRGYIKEFIQATFSVRVMQLLCLSH